MFFVVFLNSHDAFILVGVDVALSSAIKVGTIILVIAVAVDKLAGAIGKCDFKELLHIHHLILRETSMYKALIPKKPAEILMG